VSENKSLNRDTQEQRPTPLLQRGVKKRASSNPDQGGSRKRRKAAQLDENHLPEDPASFQMETDLVEDLLPPVVKDTAWQSRFIERSRVVMEKRWTTSRQDSASHFDGKGDNDGRDSDEDNDKDEEDEDEDVDGKDKDREDEDEDEDEDEPPFASEIPGISNWDLLGEDFEREAAALGLYSLYELPTQLIIL